MRMRLAAAARVGAPPAARGARQLQGKLRKREISKQKRDCFRIIGRIGFIPEKQIRPNAM